MKKTVLFSALILSAFIACKTKKAGTIATPTNSNNTPTNSAEPNAAQFAAAKTKIPSTTEEDLKKGHGIYYGACSHCHDTKNIFSFSETEWTGILDRMAPMAHLSPEEKDAVLKYVIGVRLALAK